MVHSHLGGGDAEVHQVKTLAAQTAQLAGGRAGVCVCVCVCVCGAKPLHITGKTHGGNNNKKYLRININKLQDPPAEIPQPLLKGRNKT